MASAGRSRMHGGFAIVTDVGAGKSAALRLLAAKLSPLCNVMVGEVSRPQSRVTDLYRDSAICTR